MAGLVGSSWPVSFEELVDLAQSCDWYDIEIDSDWFYQVAWDLGIMVRSPLNTLGVLLATDTD